MITAISCIVIFLVMAVLMYLRRISALLAVPLMGVLIAIVGGIPAPEILNSVIAQGALKLNQAYTTTMFGAMLADFINKKGIARALIRWTAEFSGDNPMVLGGLLTGITALLFSTLGGLGAVIMCGTVVLPVMLSVGLSELTVAALFLFGISMGGLFNLANWQLYINVLGLNKDQIAAFVLPFAAIVGFVLLIFLAIELKRRDAFWYGLFGLGGILIVLQGSHIWRPRMDGAFSNALSKINIFADNVVHAVVPNVENYLGLIAIFMLCTWAIWRHARNIKGCPGITFLTPFLPLVLVLCFHWEIIPAFLVAIAFGVLSSWERNSVTMLTRSIIEGTATVIPAVVLMVGIGILLTAVMHPAVSTALVPILKTITPHHALTYILTFTAIAPLALYRGPLNLWGMGSGLASLMKESALLGGQAIMGMFFSVGTLQGVCDPTNTQNVWVATYLGVDTQQILYKALPYAWICALGGLCFSVASGYVSW